MCINKINEILSTSNLDHGFEIYGVRKGEKVFVNSKQ